jgi:hypothetical protein
MIQTMNLYENRLREPESDYHSETRFGRFPCESLTSQADVRVFARLLSDVVVEISTEQLDAVRMFQHLFLTFMKN